MEDEKLLYPKNIHAQKQEQNIFQKEKEGRLKLSEMLGIEKVFVSFNKYVDVFLYYYNQNKSLLNDVFIP